MPCFARLIRPRSFAAFAGELGLIAFMHVAERAGDRRATDMTIVESRKRSVARKETVPRPRLPSRARHDRIVEILRSAGAVSVTQAAADLGVSDMTLRRDLLELESAGKLTRVHGGAVAAAYPRAAAEAEEPSFESRMLKQHGAKQRIAAAAATLVASHRSLAIDVGTTTFMMAQAMRPSANTKVFTSSLRVAVELAASRCEVFLSGGRVRGGELALGGPAAIAQFNSLWFDAAVIGASGPHGRRPVRLFYRGHATQTHLHRALDRQDRPVRRVKVDDAIARPGLRAG